MACFIYKSNSVYRRTLEMRTEIEEQPQWEVSTSGDNNGGFWEQLNHNTCFLGIMIQSRKWSRVGSKAWRLRFLLCGFPGHNQPPQFQLVVSRCLPRRDQSKRDFRLRTMIQQQGEKRCRWSHSLVQCDHLFIPLHKHHPSLAQHTVSALQSSALFQSLLERIEFIATKCYDYVIQFLSRSLASQLSLCLTKKNKNTKLNEILPQQEQEYCIYQKLKINWSEKVDKNDYNHLPLFRLLAISQTPPSPAIPIYISHSKMSQEVATVGRCQKWHCC